VRDPEANDKVEILLDPVPMPGQPQLVAPHAAGDDRRRALHPCRDDERQGLNAPRLRQGDPPPVSRPERARHRAGKAVFGGHEEQDRPPDAT
jgi:hypothetical protein